MPEPQPAAVLIMGATATGKSGLALALAARFPVEIVSVDSAQVYRGLDVGTAKPDVATRRHVPHHLIDVLDPAESYSAARFRADASRLIGEIRGRRRVPLLVGGTLLYFRALTRGLSDLPAADPAVRARLSSEARRAGWPALHARLARLDAAAAARLHPNDGQRIQRALEIVELTGGPARRQPGGAAGPDRGFVRLELQAPERAVLHARIEARFRDMMAAGFLEEVRRLHRRGDLTEEHPAVRTVGYRQLWQHLEGRVDLEPAVRRGIAATRQLAKRQLTWLRSERGLLPLDPEPGRALSQATAHLHAAGWEG